jgi:hypothetical protein
MKARMLSFTGLNTARQSEFTHNREQLMFRSRSFIRASVVVAVVAGASVGRAQVAAPAAASLPAAKDVIARYVTAVGGSKALLHVKSVRTTGVFEMPAAGLKGDVVVVQSLPNKMVMTTTIPGVGEINSGFNGEVAWSVNPMQGARLLEGRELEQLREESGIAAILRRAEMTSSMETVAKSEMQGQACYQVKVVYKSGRESTECYSVESGLLVGAVTKQTSPMGTVDVTTLVSDYKEIGGIKTAMKTTMQMMGQEQVMTFSKVEYDGPDDAKAFELPPAIKTMVEAKAKPKSE